VGHGCNDRQESLPEERRPSSWSSSDEYINQWLEPTLLSVLTIDFVSSIIMLQILSKVQIALYCFAGAVHAQSAGSASRTTYGNNELAVDFDNDLISRNYQDVDIQLLSPAFTNPESIPPGFSNGTSGPTPDHEMGKTWLMDQRSTRR
jgi:hypothetical protein